MKTSRATTTRARYSIRAVGPVSAAALLAVATAAFAAAPAGVTIEKPRMRLIIKNRPAAGYFTLKNNGSAAVDLTGASSTGCDSLMLHQSKDVNGVEKMLPVNDVKVPAHGSVSFAPGGYHLMCMQPQASMKVGASVPVTLTFKDGDSITTPFPVRGASGQ